MDKYKCGGCGGKEFYNACPLCCCVTLERYSDGQEDVMTDAQVKEGLLVLLSRINRVLNRPSTYESIQALREEIDRAIISAEDR